MDGHLLLTCVSCFPTTVRFQYSVSDIQASYTDAPEEEKSAMYSGIFQVQFCLMAYIRKSWNKGGSKDASQTQL